MDELIEEVSAKVHANWMEGKLRDGVVSRPSETGEELMVPYEQLSEGAKELDRRTVRTVIEVLRGIGKL